MKRFLITLIVLVLGVKFGLDYIFSEQFQEYGDRSKAQWTCYVNMFAGELYDTMSHYRKAYAVFEKVRDRCPGKKVAGSALYQMAREMGQMDRAPEEFKLYKQFLQEYPDHRKASQARKVVDVLDVSR